MTLRCALTIQAAALVVTTAMNTAPVQADQLPAGLEHVGVEQRLNDQIPLSLQFRDETGRAVRLADYFGQRPVVLTLNYFDCPMLCPLELNDLLRAMRAISWEGGRQFTVLSVSIDPHDTPAKAAEKQRWYSERYGRPHGASGWHFLTGEQPAIDRLADAVGFRFQRDGQSGQIAHVAGIMVATGDGRLSRYLLGLEYSPRDLQLALIEAGQGRTGSLAEQLLLFCFHYDENAGRYNFVILSAVRAAGMLTVFALIAAGVVLFRHERFRTSRR